MCGIAGIIGRNRHTLSAMLDRLRHRGPDARGILELPEDGAAFGHTRLSIIDLSERSNQPFVSGCGNYILSFNGEIYNYQELAEILKAKGYIFHTSSDTEVLLNWLIEFGLEQLVALDGMFAFAFYNKLVKTLTLCRDPIGEKTVYYSHARCEGEYNFAFASEIPSLLQNTWIDRELDVCALNDYLRFLYTPAPHTLYQGIKELKPGCYIQYHSLENTLHETAYYKLEEKISSPQHMSYEQAVSNFQSDFTDVISLRLRSDVPVGVYLSAGMDSNAITGRVARIVPAGNIRAFTMQYPEKYIAGHKSEAALAEEAAKWYGIETTKIPFRYDDGIYDALGRITAIFGTPFGNSTALSSEKIAASASKSHKVCLVGDGGDELHAGYPRYRALDLHCKFNRIPKSILGILKRATSILPERGRKAAQIRRLKHFFDQSNEPIWDASLNWVTYLNDTQLKALSGHDPRSEFAEHLKDIFRKFQHDPVTASAIVDLKSFVPFNLMQSADRTSMAHSLELRSPFLSTKLIESTLSIPSQYRLQKNRTKPVLADSIRGTVPDFILSQPKRAFNPPLQAYLRANIRDLEEILCSGSSALKNIVDINVVGQHFQKFNAGKADNSTLLWGLASLENWLRRQ